MIFKQFNPNTDIVAGRTTRVASGFWPDGLTSWSQSLFVDDFWSNAGTTNNPSYGSSMYDVKNSMYYLNVYPTDQYRNSADPYFSITYGHIAGNIGSGSFTKDSTTIKAYPTKTIYTQYKNLLLGTSDLDGKFSMLSSSTSVNADDIWVIDFSAYKMKDKIDEGLIEISFSGSKGQYSFIDNSPYTSTTQGVYQLIPGTVSSKPATPTYAGIGLVYPASGIVILNASLLAQYVGISYTNTTLEITKGVGPNPDGNDAHHGPASTPANSWPYNPGLNTTKDFTYNHKTLAESLRICTRPMQIRKSEYVPARHYFVRVFNGEFNYSNNPTYVYDGKDGIHAKGTIFSTDFISNPKTYITSVGLYNDNNELVAVAKTSRPWVKSFDSEILLKVRLDF